MDTAIIVIWAFGLAVGLVFGWAWGSTRTAATLSRSSAPLPEESDNWRAGYAAGYDDARKQALRVARAHDFDTIERQVGAMKPKA